jgi:hypothetical protein
VMDTCGRCAIKAIRRGWRFGEQAFREELLGQMSGRMGGSIIMERSGGRARRRRPNV